MSIQIERLVKSFGDQVVVNQVSFEVADGECFVLLGPSGSGKSTVLRLVAGLVEPDVGQVVLQGKNVTRVAPQHRGIGFVFQHYALFGHMTVAENVEFPLKVRRVRQLERKRRRGELLEMVGLVGMERRHPHQLSGGQQQRVALARALAHRPEVLLLDEPFGALDARIRLELRRTLRRIQRELKITAIFVTHDQEEAFELADRLGIMNYGRLLEVGPPQELYLHPQTEFVASFLGKANLMVGAVSKEGVRLGAASFPLSSEATGSDDSRRVQVLFRPEDVAVKLTRDALDWPPLGEGVVDEVDFSGSFERLRLRVPTGGGVRPIAPSVPFGADYMLVEATRSQHLARRYPLRNGDRAWVGVRRVHALAHLGLSFLLYDDGTSEAHEALAYGGELARLCHARITLFASGPDGADREARIRDVRQVVGSALTSVEERSGAEGGLDALGREAARQGFDLLVLPRPERGVVTRCEQVLLAGSGPVLVVPRSRPAPRNVLLCAAAGEPAKDDVFFAGRLVRHFGAEVAVLTAVGQEELREELEQVERFHAAALRTLSVFGVTARGLTPRGPVLEAILEEKQKGAHDLIVVGAPLLGPDSSFDLRGLVEDLLTTVTDIPILIVRTGQRP